MCQVSVVLENDGSTEKVMDNVTLLEVDERGVTVSTFFEEPKFVAGASVKRMDFNVGQVTLTTASGGDSSS
jgi:predicted RNA-binding protein